MIKQCKVSGERCKVLKVVFLIISLHLTLSTFNYLHAYSAVDSFWNWGEPQRGLSARSLAMGSTGISSTLDASALMVNPSLMDLGENKGSFSVTAGPLWFFDKRDHSYIGTDYVVTDNLYFELPSAAMLWSASKRNDIVLGFGFFSDFNSDYKLEEKNSDTQTTDRIDLEGGFHNWVLGANWKATPWFSMGLSYLWGSGSRNLDMYLSTAAATGALTTKTSDYFSLTGDSLMLGFDFAYEDIVNVGMFWRSGFDMNVKEKLCLVRNNAVYISSTAAYIEEFPSQMGAGLTYYFNDANDSKLIFDIIYSAWGDSKYWMTKLNGAEVAKDETSPDFFGVTEYHFGFEHTPIERTFFRYGFSYIPDYPIGSGAVSAVSLGVGIPVKQVVVDIGAEYAFRDGSQERISQVYSGFDSVAERRQKILVTTSYTW